jgi:hypothetical protein
LGMSEFEAERREAARLTWLSRRVPVGSILLGSAAATVLASAVLKPASKLRDPAVAKRSRISAPTLASHITTWRI